MIWNFESLYWFLVKSKKICQKIFFNDRTIIKNGADNDSDKFTKIGQIKERDIFWAKPEFGGPLFEIFYFSVVFDWYDFCHNTIVFLVLLLGDGGPVSDDSDGKKSYKLVLHSNSFSNFQCSVCNFYFTVVDCCCLVLFT